MSSTKPYIRKKAVLLMYKVFLNYPDALRPAFPKLKEKLEVSEDVRLMGGVGLANGLIFCLAYRSPVFLFSTATGALLLAPRPSYVLIPIFSFILFFPFLPFSPRFPQFFPSFPPSLLIPPHRLPTPPRWAE